jgi:hypothetical protein
VGSLGGNYVLCGFGEVAKCLPADSRVGGEEPVEGRSKIHDPNVIELPCQRITGKEVNAPSRG